MSSPDTQLEQLMESVRKQDDLVHSWTRILISVEGGILVAVGVLWNAGPNIVGIAFRALATAALAGVAIAACWAIVLAAISDLEWQGRYMRLVRVVQPVFFSEVPLKPKKWGRQASLYATLGGTMTLFWLLTAVAAIVKWYRA